MPRAQIGIVNNLSPVEPATDSEADRAATAQYVDLEIAARNAKAGMWVGNFALPRDWREGVR